MTRTTDDLVGGERFQPLGPPTRKPEPTKPEWTPVDGSPGIERNRQGELRTNIPANEAARPWQP